MNLFFFLRPTFTFTLFFFFSFFLLFYILRIFNNQYCRIYIYNIYVYIYYIYNIIHYINWDSMDTTYNWRGKVTKKPLPCQCPFVGGLPARFRSRSRPRVARFHLSSPPTHPPTPPFLLSFLAHPPRTLPLLPKSSARSRVSPRLSQLWFFFSLSIKVSSTMDSLYGGLDDRTYSSSLSPSRECLSEIITEITNENNVSPRDEDKRNGKFISVQVSTIVSFAT